MTETRELVRELEMMGRAGREDLARLLGAGEAEGELFAAADRVREARLGEEVQLRGLIEFSNYCRRDCRYCGLRGGNGRRPRYRMTGEEIVAAVKGAVSLGYGTVVLQSGEDPHYRADMMAALLRWIKAECEVAVTLSIGERSEAEYRQMREAGADRFLLRIETSSRELYRTLHPDGSWEARLECLRSLGRLGYQVGSGVMVGLPGQSLEMLADDLLFLQSLDLDMIGVGPFIPHPETPLAAAAGGSVQVALRFIACLRLLCPEAHIPATTALGALHPEGRRRALQAGANVLMPNCTPPEYRTQYELYPGRSYTEDTPEEARRRAERMVVELGRKVATGPGHSLRSQRVGVASCRSR